MEKVGQYTHPEERFVRCSFQFRLDGSSYLNVLMWPVTSNHNTAIHFPVSVSRFFFLSVCFKRNYWCIRAFATVSRPIFIRFYCGFSYRLFSLCILLYIVASQAKNGWWFHFSRCRAAVLNTQPNAIFLLSSWQCAYKQTTEWICFRVRANCSENFHTHFRCLCFRCDCVCGCECVYLKLWLVFTTSMQRERASSRKYTFTFVYLFIFFFCRFRFLFCAVCVAAAFVVVDAVCLFGSVCFVEMGVRQTYTIEILFSMLLSRFNSKYIGIENGRKFSSLYALIAIGFTHQMVMLIW